MAIPLLGSFEEIDDASSLASLSMENSLHMDTLFSRQTIDPQHETDKGQNRSSRVVKSSLFIAAQLEGRVLSPFESIGAELILTKSQTAAFDIITTTSSVIGVISKHSVDSVTSLYPMYRYKLGLILPRNCHNLTRIFTPGINWV
jgi:hypothetical protein